MYLFILILALSADSEPVPTNLAAYFEKVDSIKAANVLKYQQTVAEINMELKTEKAKEKIAALKNQLKVAEKALAQAKKDSPVEWMPNPAKKDDVGYLQKATVIAVIDKSTAVIRTVDLRGVVVTNINTANLRVQQGFSSPDMWVVTALTYDEPEVDRIAMTAASNNNPFVAKPINARDLAKFRAAYDAEKAVAERAEKAASVETPK